MFVYLLRSQSNPDQTYIGLSSNVLARLNEHNDGKSPHTSKFCPWRLEGYVWFSDDQKARKFERYLKSGSGRAFQERHFRQVSKVA